MHITRVQARGFKRGNFDVTLDRANVITGDNFSGKTQILDAVRLGLIGYLPELGKEARKTMGLANGPHLTVELAFDTGAVLTREFWWEGDTAKQKHVIPAALKDCPTLAVMLNAEEYFALGPIDRTRYVFANCPVGAPSHDKIISRIKVVAPGYDMDGVFDGLTAEQMERAEPMTAQEDMDWLLKHVADHWTNLSRTVQMHQGTINGITTQRADEETPDVPLATLQDQRATLTREIADLNERQGRHIGSFAQMKKDRHRREEISREIEHGTKTRLQLVDLKQKLELIDGQIAGFTLITETMSAGSLQACSDASDTIKTLERGIKAAHDERIAAGLKLAAIDRQDVCPYCGATGTGWKTLKAAEYAQAIDGFKSAESDLTSGLPLAREKLLRAQKARSDLTTEGLRQNGIDMQRAQILAQIAKLEQAVSRLTTLAEEAARLMPDDPELTTQVETLQSELNVKNNEGRGLDSLIAKAQQRAGDLVRMAEAEKQRDEAAKLKEQAALAGKELKAIQGELVAGAFRPLLARANAIFAGVLPFDLEYKDGEIGARADGVWRGHKTMSGVERALTYCAIQMALASRAPVKVAVLDEMTKLFSKRVPGFALAVLRALHSGLVDQVLAVDPERGHLYSEVKAPGDIDLAFNVIAVQ